ncbi:hypothetical protein ASG43_19275 [Aureimonas sp. Leaf454]|nr:hypothetical protein ASG43_19275 [Aureimonas sp. Leaf454]
METTQGRISTGLKIGEAKDNAAYWSISTTLKSDNKSLATVKDALGLGAATVDTAYQGLNKAKEVLDEIKSKLTAATQDGVDRSKIQTEISELQKQLQSIASSSTFSGENWLSVNSSAAGFTSAKTVVSSFSRDSAGSVAIGTIDVNIGTVKLYDSALGSDGILDGAVQLKATDGTNLTFGGAASVSGSTVPGAITSGGIANGAGVGGNATDAATSAYLPGSPLIFDDIADVLTFTVAVDGASSKTVNIRRGTVQNALSDSSNTIQISSAADLVRVVKQGLSDAGVTGVAVSLDASGFLSYTSTASLSTTAMGTRGVVVAGAAFTNTAGAETTSTVLGTVFDAAGGSTTYASAVAKTGMFTGPMLFTGDAKIEFSINVDGAGAVPVTINKAKIDAALGTTDGKINSVAEMQQVIISAIEVDTALEVGFASGDDLLVGALSDGSITFTSRGTGATSAVAVTATTVTQDTTSPVVVTGTSSIGVSTIDITDATMKARGATTDGLPGSALDGAKVRTAITAYITVVNEAINKVTTAASTLGAIAKRIDLQTTFVDTLMDTIEKGVGNLIDADLSEESTRLQALQTKQQLGVQALSIANQSTQQILRLFQ